MSDGAHRPTSARLRSAHNSTSTLASQKPLFHVRRSRTHQQAGKDLFRTNVRILPVAAINLVLRILRVERQRILVRGNVPRHLRVWVRVPPCCRERECRRHWVVRVQLWIGLGGEVGQGAERRGTKQSSAPTRCGAVRCEPESRILLPSLSMGWHVHGQHVAIGLPDQAVAGPSRSRLRLRLRCETTFRRRVESKYPVRSVEQAKRRRRWRRSG